MKILFCSLHFGSFRNYESVIQLLAARGHRVHLTAEQEEHLGGRQLVARLSRECPGVTWGASPALDREPWFNFVSKLRHALQYVRFLDPAYDARAKYRERTRVTTPRGLRAVLSLPIVRLAIVRRACARLLLRLERLAPSSDRLDAFLREQSPDVLLLASVTNPGAPHLDHVKAARRLGIPAAMCVFSWDHLSGKAWIRIAPDRVLVWNDVQKQEAIEQHGLPANRIVVTGAQCWDQWFDRVPTRTREAFCRDVGLDPSRPFVLYVCSVLSRPAPSEAEFVLDWIRRLRASGDPVLADVGILIRPHPERASEWDGVDLSGISNVALRGRNPIDSAAKDEYFESIHYSASVIGIVTTAFLESAVVGREVFAIAVPQFALHQQAAPHFHYLIDVGGGLLHLGRGFEEHFTQLRACLLGATAGRTTTNRDFLQAFVRPRGLDVPATPVFIDAVEELAASGPAPAEPEPQTVWWRFQRHVVRALALAGARGVGAWLLMDERDQQRAVLEAARTRQKRQSANDKAERERASRRRREARLEAKAAARRAKARRRSAQRRSSEGNVA